MKTKQQTGNEMYAHAIHPTHRECKILIEIVFSKNPQLTAEMVGWAMGIMAGSKLTNIAKKHGKTLSHVSSEVSKIRKILRP